MYFALEYVWGSANHPGVVSWQAGGFSHPRQATNPGRRVVIELYVDK